MTMLMLGHLLPEGAGRLILKPHAIQKRFRLGNDDPGASHHNRASASRGLQETGLNCDCWQPGEHFIMR